MRTLLLPDPMVWLPAVLVVRRGAAPRRTDLASRTGVGTSSPVGALLIGLCVLGLGSGCAAPMTDDPTAKLLRVVSGADGSRWYLRAAAAALPVTRGVPCPTSSWDLESTEDGRHWLGQRAHAEAPARSGRGGNAGLEGTERAALRGVVDERARLSERRSRGTRALSVGAARGRCVPRPSPRGSAHAGTSWRAPGRAR